MEKLYNYHKQIMEKLKSYQKQINFTYKIEKDQYISFKFQLGDQQKENLR